MIRLSRRRFLTLSGGLVIAGCTNRSELSTGSTPTTGATTTQPVPPSTTAPTSTIPPSTVVTTIATDSGVLPGDPILVMVELAGGNDALNTMPPLDDPYQALRPTLALTDDEMITATALDGYALHGSLAPIVPLIDAGRVAMIAGIGFGDPDRSHFVSTDRWLRADRMDESLGWLGRWLDGLPDDLPSLGATALGSNGRILLGADRRGTVINTAESFAFPDDLDRQALTALTQPASADPLEAAAQRAFATTIDAVDEFGVIADAVRADGPTDDYVDIGQTAFRTGLAVAAELVTSGVGARVITVKGGGFDTHSGQKGVHAALLDDLALGLAEFWAKIDAAGVSDRVLVATHSEFGRRVAENGSDGCDHGAAGLSMLMGDHVVGGVHGALTTADLLQGDLRPVIDPRTMFTTCLDWLGADAEPILGQRYDEVTLLA